MRRRCVAVALAGLAFALCAPDASAQTAEQRAALDRAERIGRDLYEHDRAAWLATDAARPVIGASERANLRGWVTLREGDAVIVDFVSERDGALWSAHRSTFRAGALSSHGLVSIPLDETRQRLFQARALAIDAPTALCAEPYNTVILPREDGGEADADVYLMPATTANRLVRVGGYVRHGVDVDARRVTETEAFSRSCLELQIPQEMRETSLMFTHITSPLPTQTHVFLNLSHGLPLFVGTETGIWQIRDGRITLLQEPSL